MEQSLWFLLNQTEKGLLFIYFFWCLLLVTQGRTHQGRELTASRQVPAPSPQRYEKDFGHGFPVSGPTIPSPCSPGVPVALGWPRPFCQAPARFLVHPPVPSPLVTGLHLVPVAAEGRGPRRPGWEGIPRGGPFWRRLLAPKGSSGGKTGKKIKADSSRRLVLRWGLSKVSFSFLLLVLTRRAALRTRS